MKIAVIVCALACVALANGVDVAINAQANRETDEVSDLIGDLRVCEPGATKKEDCNNCFCARDGSGWACTRMMCLPRDIQIPHTSASQSDQNNPTQQAGQEPANTK